MQLEGGGMNRLWSRLKIAGLCRFMDGASAPTRDWPRERVTRDQLVAGMTRFSEQHGDLESSEVTDERCVNTSNDTSLTVRMRCTFSKQPADADAQREYDTTRGHTTAVDNPAE
jgi:hypothetical protein